MKKLKNFRIVSKNPQNQETVLMDVKTNIGKYTNEKNEVLFLENFEETGRGWNFTLWGIGSKMVPVSFARGEFQKVTDLD